MEKRFKEYYEKITDPRVFIQGHWYKKPKSGELLEFLIWYNKDHSDCIESTDTQFRIIAYPTTMIRFLREAPISGTKFSNGSIAKTKKEHDPRSFAKEDKIIPGYCARPDIVANIIKLEQDEIDKRNEKHLKEMEFLKRKREFLKQSEPDDDDL